MKAYLISEPTRKNNAYLGSPAAEGISYTPAHMLSDAPNQFTIRITDPKTVRGQFVPIVMAGGKSPRDSVRSVYQRLWQNAESLYRANVKHYASLRRSTLQLVTPCLNLNRAFEWAKVAYDNLIVDNPDLGQGMVAGLGASGTSGRPGFGWFFGGDTYSNAFSLNSYGATATVRDAIAFTQTFQRQDGKMPHEISQAAGYIRWFEDYPYAYIHGDTSPFYITAVYDYYRLSGDKAFVASSWESLRKAYEWALATDEDADGLMDNTKAGLAARRGRRLLDPEYVRPDVMTSYDRKIVQYGVSHRSNSNEGFASLVLGMCPADVLPCYLWFYDRHMGRLSKAEADLRFDRGRGNTPFALMTYPAGVETKDPTGVLPKAVADRDGYIFFRNRWQDENDIQVGLLNPVRRSGGWSQNEYLNLRLMAFDTRFFGGPGKERGVENYTTLLVDGANAPKRDSRAFGP